MQKHRSGQGARLHLAAVVVDLRFLGTGKQARYAVVIIYFQEELNVGEHDPRRAVDDDIDVLAVVLSGFDRAVLELGSQTTGLGDKAAAMDTGKAGEGDPFCPPLSTKHLVASVRARGPGAGEIESTHIHRQCEHRNGQRRRKH
jgi:hypothetical protein